MYHKNQMNQIKATNFSGNQESLSVSLVHIKTRTKAFENVIHYIRQKSVSYYTNKALKFLGWCKPYQQVLLLKV